MCYIQMENPRRFTEMEGGVDSYEQSWNEVLGVQQTGLEKVNLQITAITTPSSTGARGAFCALREKMEPIAGVSSHATAGVYL